VKSAYIPALGRGIVPHEAREHHEKEAPNILNKALVESGFSIEDIDIISYSCGAGLPPCLLVGADFALNLAKKYKKQLIPVCHQIAHLEIGKLTTQAKDPVFLYLSGGNTQVIAFTEGKYRIFGETEDIPVGNALDVVARELKLPMPGGPQIEKLSKDGKYVELPYVVKGMDLSFSGIATAAIKKYKEGISKADISYSMQETCFSMLTEVTERALAHTGKKEVLLVGGVAANKRLQEMLKTMCGDRNGDVYIVPEEYSGDQGAMIAWSGILAYKSEWNANFRDKIKPNWRIDEVEITWFK
jgi:glycoprotease/Kae1 family metallohydrolase